MALEPADLTRCQAGKPNPNYGPFRYGGDPNPHIRCEEKPTVIATEKEPGEDGLRGEMSLCDNCMKVMVRQMPGVCTFRPVVVLGGGET